MGRFRSATLLLFTVILIVLVFFGAQSQIPTVFALPSFTSSNVNSPGTNVCSGCHSGSAATGGSAVVNFPSGLTYTPGVTQHLSVTVTDPRVVSAHGAFGEHCIQPGGKFYSDGHSQHRRAQWRHSGYRIIQF